MKKRAVSMILVFAMIIAVFSAIGITAMADPTYTVVVGDVSTGIPYANITAALAEEAPEGESADAPTVITLTADVADNVVIPAGRNIKIDLNGHVLSQAVSGKPVISVSAATTAPEAAAANLILTDNSSNQLHYFTYNKDSKWTLLSDTPESSVAIKDFDEDAEGVTDGATAVAVTGGIVTGAVNAVGIDCYGKMSISNVNIIGNSDRAVYCYKGNMTLNNVNIAGNLAVTAAGINEDTGSYIEMTGGCISWNTVTSDYGQPCSAIEVYSESEEEISKAVLTGVVLCGNKGGFEGTVQAFNYVELTLDGCTIEKNDSSYIDYTRGIVGTAGITTYFNPKVTVKDTEIKNNKGTAIDNGGEMTLDGVTVTGNTREVSENTALTVGGIINSVDVTLTLKNKCVISGNKSELKENEGSFVPCNLFLESQKSVILDSSFNAESEIGVSLYSYGILPFEVAETYSSCFTADSALYKITEGEDNETLLDGRINTHPTVENEYTTEVDVAGLTDPTVTYQWQKLTKKKLSELSGMYYTGEGQICGIINGDSVTSQSDVIGLQFDKSKLTEGDMLAFSCDGDLSFYLTEGIITEDNGVYFYPLYLSEYEGLCIFMLDFEEETTITDVFLANFSDVSGETASQLSKPVEETTYRCTVSINGEETHTNMVTVPKQKKDAVCTYTTSIKAGEDLTLVIGGKDAGTFTIVKKCNSGYQLKKGDEYLAYVDGSLTYQSGAFTWNYDGGLYTSVTKTATSKSRGRTCTSKNTTKYYLAFGDELGTSTKRASVCVKVSADKHSIVYKNCGDHHCEVCQNCGKTINENCKHKYDEKTNKCVCGKYDPTKIGVTTVKVKETVKSAKYGRGKNVTTKTTYNYSISATAVQTKVKKIQYSYNGTKWYSGSCISSTSQVTKLYIRVTDSNKNVTDWVYDAGTVTKA